MAVLRGDLSAAAAFHPLVFVVGPAVIGYASLVLIDAFRPLAWFRTPSAERWTSGVALCLAILLFAVWVARFAGAFGGPVATDPWFW